MKNTGVYNYLIAEILDFKLNIYYYNKSIYMYSQPKVKQNKV